MGSTSPDLTKSQNLIEEVNENRPLFGDHPKLNFEVPKAIALEVANISITAVITIFFITLSLLCAKYVQVYQSPSLKGKHDDYS